MCILVTKTIRKLGVRLLLEFKWLPPLACQSEPYASLMDEGIHHWSLWFVNSTAEQVHIFMQRGFSPMNDGCI